MEQYTRITIQEENHPLGRHQGAGASELAAAETEWSSGLCDCCHAPGGGALGCVSLFMPCVQYGVMTQQIPQGTMPCAGDFWGGCCAFYWLEFARNAVFGLCGIPCAVWVGVGIIPTSALIHMQMRKYLRRKYNIKGTCMRDLCTTWWCGPCALAQETRELIIQSQREYMTGALPAGALPPHMLGHLVVNPPAPAPAFFAHPQPHPTGTVPPGPSAPPATGFPVSSAPASKTNSRLD